MSLQTLLQMMTKTNSGLRTNFVEIFWVEHFLWMLIRFREMGDVMWCAWFIDSYTDSDTSIQIKALLTWCCCCCNLCMVFQLSIPIHRHLLAYAHIHTFTSTTCRKLKFCVHFLWGNIMLCRIKIKLCLFPSKYFNYNLNYALISNILAVLTHETHTHIP